MTSVYEALLNGFLFCCCDKNSLTKQLKEEMVYFRPHFNAESILIGNPISQMIYLILAITTPSLVRLTPKHITCNPEPFISCPQTQTMFPSFVTELLMHGVWLLGHFSHSSTVLQEISL